MTFIQALTPAEAYVTTLKTVMESGRPVAPRGMPTLEILCPQIEIMLPWVLPLNLGVLGRNLNPFIGAAEALQLVGQTSNPKLMTDRVKAFEAFLDDGQFHGAYGPRVNRQLELAEDALKRDPDTRQAVVTIFHGAFDLGVLKKDIPCTIALHFFIRNKCLFLRTMMRSNDVWLGLPYDLIQFIALQGAMAKALDLEMGSYLHTATSLHIYEKDYEKVDAVSNVGAPYSYQPMWSGDSIRKISRNARLILGNVPIGQPVTGFERELSKAIA